MATFGAIIDRQLWRIPTKIPEHPQTRTIESGQSGLRIRDSGGSRDAVVFFCDPPVTVEAYDALTEAFQSHYRVIIVELPGFGFSRTTTARQLTFSGAVEAVENSLGALDLESVVLFGPCVCGFVASELAVRAQLPVRGLVLMQTPDKAGMISWVSRMDPKGLLRVPGVGQFIVRFNAKRLVRFWMKFATAKSFDAEPMTACTLTALRQGGGYPLATMLQLWSGGTRDAGLDLPGLIVWGRQDRSHAETSPECSRAHLMGAEIIEFSDCGHFTELEMPDGFAASVLPFLSRCFGARDA